MERDRKRYLDMIDRHAGERGIYDPATGRLVYVYQHRGQWWVTDEREALPAATEDAADELADRWLRLGFPFIRSAQRSSCPRTGVS